MISKKSKIVYLWDIDGTILLTGGAGIQAFNRVFEQIYGEKYIWDNISPDGRTDPLIIDELYFKRFKQHPSEEEKTKIFTLYNRYMAEELPQSTRFRLMPYVRETLTRLSKNPDIVLGLATGNFEDSAKYKLKQAGLIDFFKFGGYGSDAHDRLELTQLALSRAIDFIGGKPSFLYLVGDTVHDVYCGQKIGAKTIGVCTGSTSREDLEKAHADWVIDDLSEFPYLLISP